MRSLENAASRVDKDGFFELNVRYDNATLDVKTAYGALREPETICKGALNCDSVVPH